jgi:anti-sigma B factor antagonist
MPGSSSTSKKIREGSDMDAPETRVSVEEKDGVALLRFEGDITSFSEAAVLGTYRGLPEEPYRNCLLDFTKVDYINSSGIAVIITMLMEASKAGRKVHCFGLTPHFKKVFEMVGLLKYTAIHPDEATGLAAVR